jgi:hypothetical protein
VLICKILGIENSPANRSRVFSNPEIYGKIDSFVPQTRTTKLYFPNAKPHTHTATFERRKKMNYATNVAQLTDQ